MYFPPFSPEQALALVESAGVQNARVLIRDYAAAGLVRSVALVIETVEVSGSRSKTGGEVPSELWERIICEGADEDIWTAGTVRLLPSALVVGQPAVNITGIRFNVMDLHRLIRSRRRDHTERKPSVRTNHGVSAQEGTNESATPTKTAERRVRRAPDPYAIPPGALLATSKQAEAALGYGRTKINELLNAGQLERAEGVDGLRIKVSSIRALAGMPD